MPPYRLQTLLEIRERAEDAAKEAFSIALRELVTQEKKLAALESDLKTRQEQRKAKVQAYLEEIMAKGTGVSGMNAMNRFEQRLKDEEAQVALEIARQKELVRAAQKEVDLKRREMAEAAMEKKAIEKHKDNWKVEVRKERDNKEQIAQEEIGNALHLRRTRTENDA